MDMGIDMDMGMDVGVGMDMGMGMGMGNAQVTCACVRGIPCPHVLRAPTCAAHRAHMRSQSSPLLRTPAGMLDAEEMQALISPSKDRSPRSAKRRNR